MRKLGFPIYSVSPTSFDVAFQTFASVFEHSTFWYVRGHGLFVATLDPRPINYAAIRERFMAPAVRRDFASIDITSPEAFMSFLLMGPNEITTYLTRSGLSRVVNTDDNAYLEYRTPFEFLHSPKDVVHRFAPYAGYDPSVLTNISEAERQIVSDFWARRQARILSELEESVN